MFKDFTYKQKSFLLDVIHDKLSRINILSGSVRSGKTFISLIAFVLMVAKSKKTDTFLVCGKTITSLKRNCFDLISNICGDDFKYTQQSKQGELFGRKIFFEGVNDSRSENKIRGMTLTGAYCDEITLFTYDFFSMLLSRLSRENAFLIGTTNPDSPMHWVKKNYIDRKEELDLKVYEFLIDDNTTLEKSYIENIKREFTGVFYDRFILGKWVNAQGAIYRVFSDNPSNYLFEKLNDKISFITIGIDYGASFSKTVFVATGFSTNMEKVYLLEEYSLSGIHEPNDIYQHFYEFYKSISKNYGSPYTAYCDYGALGQVLTRGLHNFCMTNSIPIKICDCNKGTINDRIQLTCQLFGQNRLFINSKCKHTISALFNAIWQENKVDTRLDDGTVEIDFLDAFEYSIYNFNNKLIAIHK